MRQIIFPEKPLFITTLFRNIIYKIFDKPLRLLCLFFLCSLLNKSSNYLPQSFIESLTDFILIYLITILTIARVWVSYHAACEYPIWNTIYNHVMIWTLEVCSGVHTELLSKLIIIKSEQRKDKVTTAIIKHRQCTNWGCRCLGRHLM